MLPRYGSCIFGAVLLAQIAVARQSLPVATASVQGIVLKLGTNDPIAGVEVELTRLEGTARAPLARGALETYHQLFSVGGNLGSAPPAAIAPEVKYAVTNSDGRFVFQNLKEGKYRLVSARVGGAFVPGEFGQRDPLGRGYLFPVAEGAALKDLKLEMAASAAITGRVFDSDNEPLGHVSVVALEPQYRDGRRVLNIAQSVTTDAQGNYRLYWLPPGRYYVAAKKEDLQKRDMPFSAMPPGRRGLYDRAEEPFVTRTLLPTGDVVEEAYQLVYHGGTLSSENAKEIDLPSGGIAPAIDIFIGLGKLRSFHLRGIVVDGIAGRPVPDISVMGIPRQWSPVLLVLNGTTDANGGFDLAGAVPGGYTIIATPLASLGVGGPGGPPPPPPPLGDPGVVSPSRLMGHASADIARANVENLRVVAVPALTVSGRVIFENRPANITEQDVARIRVGLSRNPDILVMPPALVPGVPRNGAVAANGDFALQIWPGEFRVSAAPLPPNTYVKSIRMGSSDVLGEGLHLTNSVGALMEIVIASDGGEVSGQAVNDRGGPLPNVVVALVPDSPSLRSRADLYQSVTTDSSGSFQLQTVPPGNYKLFAWEYAIHDVWQDPLFLQRYETLGKPISILPGKAQEVQITVVPGGR
jgi:hypothetical protein